MSFDSFVLWLKNVAWLNLLSWFGTEAQRVASFLYPVLKKSDTLVKSGALDDIISLVPRVAIDISTKNFIDLLNDVKQLIADIAKIRDIILDDGELTFYATGVIKQAEASQSSVHASPLTPTGEAQAAAGQLSGAGSSAAIPAGGA